MGSQFSSLIGEVEEVCSYWIFFHAALEYWRNVWTINMCHWSCHWLQVGQELQLYPTTKPMPTHIQACLNESGINSTNWSGRMALCLISWEPHRSSCKCQQLCMHWQIGSWQYYKDFCFEIVSRELLQFCPSRQLEGYFQIDRVSLWPSLMSIFSWGLLRFCIEHQCIPQNF